MLQRLVRVVLHVVVMLMILSMAAVTAFGQTKLVFLNPHVDDPYVTARQKAIERFQASHPGVEVEMITPGSAYFDRMLALIASGNPPDIVATNIGADVWRLVRDGIAADLTTLWERDNEFASAFSPHIMREASLDGKVLGRADQHSCGIRALVQPGYVFGGRIAFPRPGLDARRFPVDRPRACP